MTALMDEFILIHKQYNPSYQPPRLDPAEYQVQPNLSRRVMATQVATNKYVIEVKKYIWKKSIKI